MKMSLHISIFELILIFPRGLKPDRVGVTHQAHPKLTLLRLKRRALWILGEEGNAGVDIRITYGAVLEFPRFNPISQRQYDQLGPPALPGGIHTMMQKRS